MGNPVKMIPLSSRKTISDILCRSTDIEKRRKSSGREKTPYQAQ
jgi:hypothetical protein